MGKTTVLRVKRLRDEPPPPSTFTLQPFALSSQPSLASNNDNTISSSKLKKQKGNEESSLSDATHLTQLMHDSTFLKKRDHQVRSIIPDHASIRSYKTATPVTTANQNNNHLQSNSNNQALPIEKDDVNTNNSSRSKNQRAIVFRRVINGNSNDTFYDDSPHAPTKKNSIINKNREKKRKLDVVQVVDALLDSITPAPSRTPTVVSPAPNNKRNSTNNHNDGDGDESGRYLHQHQSKRKRISLQMVETRTMTETEFWHVQRVQQQQQQQKQDASFPKGKKLTSNIALRARMKRDAAAATSQRPTVPQSLGSTRQRWQKKKSKSVILDPLSKRIDESLCALTMATTPITQQQHLLHPNGPINDSNDPHNLMASHLHLLESNIVPAKSKSKYFNWNCTNGTGTFLHCTALFSCVDITRYLCKEYAAILDFNVRDDGGLTASEVAESCGSRGNVELIDHYAEMMGVNRGGVEGCSKTKSEAEGRRDRNVEEREEGDYVYDLYCCQEGEDNDDKKKNDDEEEINNSNTECRGEEQYSKERNEMNGHSGNNFFTGDLSVATGQGDVTHQETMLPTEKRQQCSPVSAEAKAKDVPIVETQESSSTVSSSMGVGESQEKKLSSGNEGTDSRPITVEMHGSVGYWNEYGELVLEATNISNANNHESGGKDADMMTNDDGDELDSNCEEFDGNDYPEDEDDNDNEALFSEMPHQYDTQSSSFDHGHDDPEYGSGAFMTATMNGVGRYSTIADDSDYDDDNSDKLSHFRDQQVDLSNYEGFGQHYVRRGDGFYADTIADNIEDDAEDDAYSHYTGPTWGNQVSNAEAQYAYDPDLDG